MRRLQKVITGAHVLGYKVSGGAGPLGRISGLDMLLLTTTGRRSGEPRTVPLMYVTDGDDIALIASNGGSPTSPDWWSNLRAHPEATVQLKREKRRVRARKATREEKERLWPLFARNYRGYDWYQRRTTRDIPVVILSPAEPSSPRRG